MNRPATLDPVARARALGPTIAGAADEIERTRRIPQPLLGQLHTSGLLRLLLPRNCGGEQVEPGTYLLAIEEISRHDASVGWNMFVGNSSGLIAPFLPLEIAQTIYADPTSLIAWGPPNACTAQAVEGGYRVNGEWSFASGCRQANWMGAHCRVLEPDGTIRLNRFGAPHIRTLLFPATQAELLDTWNTIGLRGTASDSYRVTDVFVTEPYTTTREDPALRREPGPLYAFTMQGLYAVGCAGVALGVARAMLEAFMALAARKVPRGLARLADNAVIQAEVARCEAKIGAARAYLLETLADIHARADEMAPIEVEDRGRVRLACANAIQMAVEVADYTYRNAGVDAIFPGTPFERRFRDIHTLSQQIQSRTAHFEAAGQVLLGMPPAGFL